MSADRGASRLVHFRPALRPAAVIAVVIAGLAQPLFPGTISAARAQTMSALPDQTSRIRLSNRDVNHIVCQGGIIEDVKFSVEKGLAVERGGADAWIKFLVREIDDGGHRTRSYVTEPAEFFVTCNSAVYPLYAEPSDIPAQTVVLLSGVAQRARANEALLGPLVEEERAVSLAQAVLQERVPASFTEMAPGRARLQLVARPELGLVERRRLMIEGSGLSVSEYLVSARTATPLDERDFLDRTLGSEIFAVTLDRQELKAGEAARLVVIRRERQP